MDRLTEGSYSRPRILALHGRGSNGAVTKMQMKNLGISETEYEIVCFNGPIVVSKPGPGLNDLEELVSGPWYSWFPSLDDDQLPSGESLSQAICDAMHAVLSILEKEGPFDGVFGFSQGGVVAGLVNGLSADETLIAALRSRAGITTPSVEIHVAPFKAAVIACAGLPVSLSELRSRAGLGPLPAVSPCYQSIHLIGREDDYKAWSESFALSLNSTRTNVLYLTGGHEINRLQQNDAELCELIRQCFNGSRSEVLDPLNPPHELTWKRSSDRSSRAISSGTQVTAVKAETKDLPDTIIGMLAAQAGSAPLLRLARQQDPNAYTSYGQLLAFCRPGGDGDLRRLGVQHGEIVAYLAPPGGSATAAVAFLSIASQTCALPLAPNMSESDVLQLLEQHGVRHLIMFEGVSAPGVKAACDSYTKREKGQVHLATNLGMPSPGLYIYKTSVQEFQHLPALINSPTSYCLLLRTSGSTSAPKIVPLRQSNLVLNAAILADGIAINADDVTYSVMPLDHIGGISASILCSVAVGASITCDGPYNPTDMVDALMHSNPRPTWYSAVPTIHNATARYLRENSSAYLDPGGKWSSHNLRMIRSGAAALKEVDRQALEVLYGCEVVATYSMSEQMPVCQPPRNEAAGRRQPGSVGVPVIASMAVVDPATLRPLPFGVAGNVAISGSTVCDGYLNNSIANRDSYFLLKAYDDGLLRRWFLTGDLGELDSDAVLSLRGRIKELIKRGGEQISPFEIESVVTQHPWVGNAVCFPVPSEIYGEEVGCALVLESNVSTKAAHQDVIKEIKEFLKAKGLASYKLPTLMKIVAEDDLPKTSSKKYIRNGLAGVLGLGHSVMQAPSLPIANPRNMESARPVVFQDKPKVDWPTLAGFRFLLACYVMFMHIGSDQSWGAVANLRQFPWHVHAFFVIAGFSLAVYMPPLINRKLSFVWTRVSTMYPLYALALLFALINLLHSCQPSTFSAIFHWNAQPTDIGQAFCEGTPFLQDSWTENLFSTLIIHLAGLSATPLWGASWFMGFYLWFISMYFQCLVVYPILYNLIYKSRGKTTKLLLLTVFGLGLNVFILLLFWYGYAVDATGYGFFNQLTGEKIVPTVAQMKSADADNAVMLGFYLFAPFWMVYFAAGVCIAFVYDAIRPAEQSRSHVWGYVADAITVLVVLFSAAHVAQGYIPHGSAVVPASFDTFFMRPAVADSFMDPGIVNRIWDEVNSRLFAPITLLWIFALSTGQGLTAKILKCNPVSQTLAPMAYACFLFHQMVGQWYYAITRHGEWWNWWNYRKDFYWFSPQPVPIEWYEYFYVVGLVVVFGRLVQPFDVVIRRGFDWVASALKGGGEESRAPAPVKDTLAVILQVVQRATGIEAQPDWSLEECGLASLGVVQFTNTLQNEFSISNQKIKLSVSAIMAARDIREIVAIVDAAKDEMMQPQGQILQTL